MTSKINVPVRVLFFAVTISGLSFFPSFLTAHAGVFSFLSGVLTIDKVNSEESTDGKYNSQNIALLQAPLAAKVSVGGGDISIVDSTALEYQVEPGAEAYQSDQISSYVVREGDTLSQIAKMFNVSINTVVWANDINNGVIVPGQNLIILPVTGVKHVVKNGDTLDSISKLHKGDLKEILQFNNLEDGASLAVGDLVIIPNGEATSPTVKSGGSVSGTKTAPSGYYVRPIAGGRKSQGIHGYNGVDLAASIGTKVVASAAGKVIVSKNNGAYNGGYGNYIVIAHPNGTQTLYGHLNSTAVGVGANVTQGQLIGYLGNTGRSTGPHVHFEIRGAKNPF